MNGKNKRDKTGLRCPLSGETMTYMSLGNGGVLTNISVRPD